MGSNIRRTPAAVDSMRLLWWSLFLGMAIVCHARNHVSFSGKDEIMLMGWAGRSLKAADLNDYNDPRANQGHDPRTRVSPDPGSDLGSGSGRKTRGSPDTP